MWSNLNDNITNIHQSWATSILMILQWKVKLSNVLRSFNVYSPPTALAYAQQRDCERAMRGLERDFHIQTWVNDILCVYARHSAHNRNTHGLDVAGNSLFIETTNQNVKVSPGGRFQLSNPWPASVFQSQPSFTSMTARGFSTATAFYCLFEPFIVNKTHLKTLHVLLAW